MMNNSLNAAQRRKGIFLLIMPLILLPVFFLVLSSSNSVSGEIQKPVIGMNLEMPKPILSKKQESKSEAYVAEVKGKEEETWGLPDFLVNPDEQGAIIESESFGFSPVSSFGGERAGLLMQDRSSVPNRASNSTSEPEVEMIRQLKELESLLNQSADAEKQRGLAVGSFGAVSGDRELLQLEQLMGRMETKPVEPDPEIEQLEQLIDKLLLLQNPGLAKGLESLDREIIPVPLAEGEKEGQELEDFLEVEANGFFGLEEKQGSAVSGSRVFRKTIAASVAKTQEIFPGEAIEIQLEQDMNLESGLIPAGTVLFAQTSISGTRLQVTVSGILQDKQLIPVSLKGYGLDGIPGIELGEVAGSAQWLRQTGNSAQGININSVGMDWQSQLATSGVEATRSLLRSKTRQKKLEIKSGHPFLLIDSSTTISQNP